MLLIGLSLKNPTTDSLVYCIPSFLRCFSYKYCFVVERNKIAKSLLVYFFSSISDLIFCATYIASISEVFKSSKSFSFIFSENSFSSSLFSSS